MMAQPSNRRDREQRCKASWPVLLGVCEEEPSGMVVVTLPQRDRDLSPCSLMAMCLAEQRDRPQVEDIVVPLSEYSPN